MSTYQPHVEPITERYLDRLTIESAVQMAKERIEEWDYDEDAHGYCHERTVLIRLVQFYETHQPVDAP